MDSSIFESLSETWWHAKLQGSLRETARFEKTQASTPVSLLEHSDLSALVFFLS